MLRHAFSSVRSAAMTKKPPKDPLIVVLGATGTGKSQLAVDLAQRFNGEVVNGDAMQMYDGLPIITNKITVEEQHGIPHHLLGFIALDEEPWRVGMFRQKAGQVIREIRSRGRLPIVVGGTHYYTQSLLFDDSLVPEHSNEKEVQSTLSNQEISRRFPMLDGPTETMLELLRETDPVMAARWHPNDRRKIRRSLEIFLMTGRKASDIYAEQKEQKNMKLRTESELDIGSCSVADLGSILLFWVHCDSNILKTRLDRRVEEMMDAGLLKEVISMDEYLHSQESAGISVDRTRGIWASIGWKEFEPYLNALASGTASQEDLNILYNLSVEHTQGMTRQYAKRQVRWIRLKLIHALSEVNALDRLYLVDGSDVIRWAENVSDLAIDVCTSFLAGRELRPPHELSSAALQFLDPKGAMEEHDIVFRQECELCQVTAVTGSQWETHLKGRRHRALVKRKQGS